MQKLTKRAQAQLDDRIEAAFKANNPGEINVFSIGAIFRAGREAYANGGDVEAAVIQSARLAGMAARGELNTRRAS